MNVIKVSRLTKVFRIPKSKSFLKKLFLPEYMSVNAVTKISFEIKEGEIVAFLGPNGAGKTTTLKMLTGILYPTAGKVNVLGFNPINRDREYLKQIGLVMGNKSGLSWDLSAMQNYKLFKLMYDLSDADFKNNVHDLVDVLDAQEYLDIPVRYLSLGQRMKTELIGSILHNPKILFLDEPTIGLDVVAQSSIRNFLKEINRKYKTTIIITSHNMEDIEQVCKRVIVVNRGKLIYDNSLEKLVRKYSGKKYLNIVFNEKPDVSILSQYGRIVSSGKMNVLIELSRKSQGKVIAEIMDKFKVDDLDITGVPLSEIIAEMFV